MDDQLYEKFIILFPTCPFVISVVDDINEINEILSDETVLFIYDDRANKYNHYELRNDRVYKNVREPIFTI